MSPLHATLHAYLDTGQELVVAAIVLLAVAFLLWRLLRREATPGCSDSCHGPTREPSKLLKPESLVRNKHQTRDEQKLRQNP